MKILVTIIAVLTSVFYLHVERKMSSVERKIFEIYENNFDGFLYMDSKSNIRFDDKCLIESLESNDVEIVVLESETSLIFELSYKYFINHNKRFEFYIEKNYEIE